MTATQERKLRIIVAKPGLDGHDRGAKIIARALRDAGIEVIYTGLHQTPEMIAAAALQEDVDAVGLSIMSGAHMTLFPAVIESLRARGASEVVVFGGGIIPRGRRGQAEGAGRGRGVPPWHPHPDRHRLDQGPREGARRSLRRGRLGAVPWGRYRANRSQEAQEAWPGPSVAPPPEGRGRMARRITVYEVGPRDGLQNEARFVPTEGKLRLLRLLADAGLPAIEATSFVSPRWIPALADAAEVVAQAPAREGLVYVALVPNEVGLERLLEARGRGLPGEAVARFDAAVVVSASESHNRKNLNRPVEETLAGLARLVPAALKGGLRVRGYVSTAFGCPYEGEVEPAQVEAIALRLLDLGCHQISLGDTIGVATPGRVGELVRRLLARAPPEALALHLHDTRGTALANVLAGLQAGLTTFDAAVGGLGGCPYAPGASGNLATEDLVYMLHGMGYETGVDWPLLVAAGELAQRLVGHPLPGKALQAELARRTLLASAASAP